MMQSLAQRVAVLPENQLVEAVTGLTDAEIATLLYDWHFWARPTQLPPSKWGVDGCFIWIVRAGRGWGKTRTGAETFLDEIRSGRATYPNLAGATAEDVRDLMIEGESGILAIAPPNFRPDYVPSQKKLVWPNGVVSRIYYGSEPEKSRGAQSDLLWCDELAKWRYAEETFNNLMLGLRLGQSPRCIITTTPKPTRFLIELEKRQDTAGRPSAVVTRGSTNENYQNLSPVFISAVVSVYEGTRLGRQELNAEFLDDNPGALWKRTVIENLRVREHPPLIRIVVGVDPAVTSDVKSNETGIIVAGIAADGHCYVLDDASLRGSPLAWAAAIKRVYDQYQVDRVVGEQNNGGELVEANVRTVDPLISYRGVWASRGKQTRAEPISSLYEQGKVHHVGAFPLLEDQMCDWAPDSGDPSPDRMDALVWALTALTQNPQSGVSVRSRRRPGT